MTFALLINAAPVAGVSNRAFREVCRAHGADAAWGEMVSARALGYGSQRTLELMDIENEQTPRIVQISGCEADFVAHAAEVAVELGADMIDLNMGCPVPKVVKNGEGSFLMTQPDLAAELVRAAAAAGRPVSCKFRSGWDEQQLNAVSFAQTLEQAGAALLTVHARTRRQMYSGKADWSVIAAVKQAVSLPVIGNGDIFSAADALCMREQTGCDGVMVGRGLFGNPGLRGQVRAAFANQPPPLPPTRQEIAAQALRQLRRHIERTRLWVAQRDGDSAAAQRLGEELAVRAMRNQLGWYTKGQRDGAALRCRLMQSVSYAETAALFEPWLTA